MAQIKLTVNTDLKQAKAAVNTLKTSFADLAKQLSTITVNKNLTAQLNALTKYYDSVANAGARAAQQTRGTAANVETLRKGYANLVNQLNTLQKQYASGTFDATRKSIEQNFEAVKKLSQAQEVNGDEVKRLSGEYKKLAADVAQFRAEGEKLKTSDPFSPKQGDSIFRLQKQYASLLNSIKSAEQYYPKGTFDGIAKGAQEAVTGLQALGQEYTKTGTLSDASQKQLNAFSEGLNRQRAAFETTKNSAQNYHGTLRDIIQGFIKFQLSASIVMNSIQLIRSAFDSLNETLVETEKVVVSIQRVLDETVEGGKIADSLYDIAERLGQSFDNVQEIAQNFAKAGLSWQETLEATEAAVLALNVAELTATESSEGLIAVMQQFNYEASELTYVIDVLNKAADKSAVDTPALLVALQKTGSYAAAANLSLEQTVGLISALSEATAASGQNIGNALKSLFSYTTRDSSLDTFASLSDEMNEVVEQYRLGAKSILDVWEQLSVEMQSLDAQQADALSQWTESSGLDAELEGELSEIYDSLTGVYDSAGVYRKNYFIALMNNFDEVKEVMGEISDAQGYTAEEQAKYMDTYEAKLNSLQAQWEHLANDEQGWLAFRKGLLDIASGILDIIEKIGGLRTVVVGLSTVMWILFGNKIISAIKSFGSAIKALVTGFKSLAGAAGAAQAALGWIGIIATVASMIGGAVQQAKAEEIERINESISSGIEVLNKYEEAITDTAQSYEKLSGEIEELRRVLDSENSTTAEVASAKEELLKIQEELAENTNQKYADSIDLVNGKLEDQLDLIGKLKEEELKQQVSDYLRENADAIYDAEKYLSEKLSQIEFSGESIGFWSSVGQDKPLEKWLKENGYDSREMATSFWAGLGSFFTDSSNATTRLLTENLTRTEQIDLLEDLFDLAGQEEDKELAEYLQSTIRSAINEIKNDSTYQSALSLIFGDEDTSGFTSLPLEILQKYNEGLITTEEFLRLWLDIEEEITDEEENHIKKIEDLTEDTLDNLVNKLKEVRDIEKESLELEEKKQAVLDAQNNLIEAQKALEDAKNARGIWRYDESTGQFGWVQDEKAIAEAEEDVKDAEEDLNQAVENLNDTVNDTIVSELESGNATNESILAILAGIASTIDNQGVRDYLNGVLETIRGQGIDIGDISYDGGGIARGLGLMPKATSRPESVNDPALTAKILSPTSNAQFDRYVRDMGIMFEQARAYTQAPVLQSAVGNTTNNTTDNSIFINGVKIGSDMMSRPFGEVLQMVSMVAKN